MAQGGDDTPVLYAVPVCDVSGAGLMAFAAALGVFHRLRTGEGQYLHTSLAAAGLFMQSGQLVETSTGPDRTLLPQGGRDFAGPSELDRFHTVRDGWIRLQAMPGTTEEQVAAAVGAPTATVRAALADLEADVALERLRAAGIPAAQARLARDLVISGEYADRFQERNVSTDTQYYRPQRYMAFSRTPHHQDMYSPGAGEHSLEILRETGFSADEIDALIDDSHAVHVGQPMQPRVLNPYR